MKLKYKTFLMGILSSLLLVGITYFIFYIAYFGYIKNHQNHQITSDFKAIDIIIKNEENNLATLLEDWGYWDDTYAFIKDKNSDYIKSNLQDNSLESLNINSAIYYNSNGELIYSKDYNLDKSISESLIKIMSENISELASTKDLPETTTGLLVVNNKAYLVGAANITDSLQGSPSNGALVFIRDIDDSLIDYIKKVLDVNLSFSSYDASSSGNMTKSYSNLYYTESNNVIKDINGDTSIVLSILRHNSGYSTIYHYLNIFIACFLLILLVILVTDLLLVNKYFFKRISKLTHFVNDVAESKDTSSLVEINGNDDLNQLADSMNNMLSALSTANKDISQMDERYRLLMEATNDGYLDYYLQTDEMYISPEWRVLIGYTSENGKALTRDYLSSIHLDCYDKIVGSLRDVISGKIEYFEAEYRVITAAGKTIWVLHRGKTIEKDKDNRPVRIISTLQNITARKNHEDEILFLSYSDKLTGLRNRAFMEDRFLELDQDEDSSYYIIMGDLNGLKLTNEAFGHTEGDKLISYAGGVLKNIFSTKDIISRWGGDEFIILIKDTDEARVVALLSAIRDAMKKIAYFRFSITMALGYAAKTEDCPNAAAVMTLAEKRMLRNKLMEHSSSRSAAIDSLVKTLHEKSSETEEHTMRIRTLSTKLAQKLGLAQDKLDELALLSLLHDIGKIGIPEQILMKPSKLTDDEWALMKTHTEIGYRIAKSTPELEHIADEILAHHEKFDGTGYPKGLKGDEIPFLSRIINVVDSYDVMTHSRVYKAASDNAYALSELVRCSGTQFDPYITKVFMQLLDEERDLQKELLNA